jgi:hypothetical protein
MEATVAAVPCVIPYIVRCKCGAAARVDVPAKRVEKVRYTRGIIGVPGSAEAQHYAVKEEIYDRDSFLLATISAWTSAHQRCWACGLRLKIDRIKGTYAPDHRCDARCTGATGHNCECSCGGKNHGKGWS